MERLKSRNIYLAGKINPWQRNGPNDWRFDIVPELPWSIGDQWLRDYVAAHDEWYLLPKAIFGRYNYVGPFFTNLEDSYGGHGGWLEYPHGLDISASPKFIDGHNTGACREIVTKLCLKAIRRADLVFAWIDSADCYGTLFELGYAKALGKTTAVYFSHGDFARREVDRPWQEDDEGQVPLDAVFFELWFTYFACDGRLINGSPLEALQQVIVDLGWEAFPKPLDSPLEEAFAEAWIRQGQHLVFPLSSQYPIKDGSYRLDFAFPPLQVGIELDGYTYHSDREAFTRDRQRQREIEALGWRIIRFSGDEIRGDIDRCIREAAHFLSITKHNRG